MNMIFSSTWLNSYIALYILKREHINLSETVPSVTLIAYQNVQLTDPVNPYGLAKPIRRIRGWYTSHSPRPSCIRPAHQ